MSGGATLSDPKADGPSTRQPDAETARKPRKPREKNKKICVICGKEFACPPSDKTVTCSPECRSIRAGRAIIARCKGVKWTEEKRAKYASSPAVQKNVRKAQKIATEAAARNPLNTKGIQNRCAKIWVLCSPDGEVFEVVNLTQWARENYKLFEPECDNPDAAANRIRAGFQAIDQSIRGKRGEKRKNRCSWHYKDWALLGKSREKDPIYTQINLKRCSKMKYKDFIRLKMDVLEFSNFEDYLADCGGSVPEAVPEDQVEKTIRYIWDYAHEKTFRSVIELAGCGVSEAARQLNVPLRTVQGWAGGERTPPEYVLDMCASIILDWMLD